MIFLFRFLQFDFLKGNWSFMVGGRWRPISRQSAVFSRAVVGRP